MCIDLKYIQLMDFYLHQDIEHLQHLIMLFHVPSQSKPLPKGNCFSDLSQHRLILPVFEFYINGSYHIYSFVCMSFYSTICMLLHIAIVNFFHSCFIFHCIAQIIQFVADGHLAQFPVFYYFDYFSMNILLYVFWRHKHTFLLGINCCVT